MPAKCHGGPLPPGRGLRLWGTTGAALLPARGARRRGRAGGRVPPARSHAGRSGAVLSGTLGRLLVAVPVARRVPVAVAVPGVVAIRGRVVGIADLLRAGRGCLGR